MAGWRDARVRDLAAGTLALASILATGAPATAQLGEEQTIRAPAEQPPTDASIGQRLERVLSASGWFENLNVEIREGVAFLDGVAATEDQRDWAASVAGRLDGVIAVVNRMEVRPAISWDLSPAWREVESLTRGAQRAVPIVVIAIVILLVAWQLARAVTSLSRRLLRRQISSPLMLSVVARAAGVPVLIIGLYLVLQISGLTSLALTVLGGTGVAGLIVGFAFRDIAENFLASLLLSIRNPFHAGDLVRVGDQEGIVTNLNTRSTVLLTLDGNHIQIPNALVFKSVILNYSSNPSRRAEFKVGIGYDDRTGDAQTVIDEVLSGHPAVRKDPAPFVVVDELAASTVNLKVYFWFDSTTYSPLKLRSALMRQTKHALLSRGISMPDEAREIIFPQGLPLRFPTPGEKPKRQETPAAASGEELDAIRAEGGLAAEDDAVLREAGETRTSEERENLLSGKNAPPRPSPPSGPR